MRTLESPVIGYVISGSQTICILIDNRLRLTRQLYFFSIFAGGLGAALLGILHWEPSLLSRVHIPKPRVFGTIRADEKVKVIHFTSWDTTYFILNRRSPQHSEGSAGPSKFPASLGGFGSAGIHSQLITPIALNYQGVRILSD